MTTPSIPLPMPPVMRDETNARLDCRELDALGDDGRFIVRALVAEAYARGFADGRFDEQVAGATNRRIERIKTEAAK